jgi:uncharacterized protein YqjF (DUF2071 family)
MIQSWMSTVFKAAANCSPRARGDWLMAQTWQDLLFAHWPVSASALNPLLPAGLEPDVFEDQAWLSVVVFRITDLHLRGWPAIPGLRSFPEVNLRTYVRHPDSGRCGVFFLSLHCPDRLAIALARPWYLLPYQYLPLTVSDGQCRSPALTADYSPCGAVSQSQPGSLDHWLTERYCYFTASETNLFRCDIQHAPWPLQPAVASFSTNKLLPGREPPALLQYSKHIEAVIWPLSPLQPRSASAPPPAPSDQPAPPSPRRSAYTPTGSRR